MENSELVVFIGSALLCQNDKTRAHTIYVFVLLFIVFIFTMVILLLHCKFSLVFDLVYKSFFEYVIFKLSPNQRNYKNSLELV